MYNIKNIFYIIYKICMIYSRILYTYSCAVSYSLSSDQSNSEAHTDLILQDLGLDPSFSSLTEGWDRYSEDPQSGWQSVFGLPDTHSDMGISTKIADATNHNDTDGENEWDNLFGDEVLGSTFQDGHYVYAVVAGGGTGADVYPPTIYVVDIESAVDFNNVLMP